MNLRPYRHTTADNRAITRLENLTWPDHPTTEEEQQHQRDALPSNIWMEEWCVELADHVVAYGYVIEGFWTSQPHLFEIAVTTEPAYQRRGIGSRLYDHCLHRLQAVHTVTDLVTKTREDKPDTVRFLAQRGFVLQMREPESTLDVAAFPFASFSAKERQVQAHGVTLHTLAALASYCPDWQTRWWHLINAIMHDVPRPDPYIPPPLAQFVQRRIEKPNFDAATKWIAVHGKQWVGNTELWPPPSSRERVSTGLTGVIRGYRRLGIATALKLQAIRYARDHGFATIVTDNEEHNPMFRINQELGFHPQPAWLRFRKSYGAPSNEDRPHA